jgi:hypothetical protein
MADSTQALATEKEARDVAEAARESEWREPSFVRDLFLGSYRPELIHPHPEDDPAEVARAKPFMDKLRAFMERVDSDEIDRTGHIPSHWCRSCATWAPSASRSLASTVGSASRR